MFLQAFREPKAKLGECADACFFNQRVHLYARRTGRRCIRDQCGLIDRGLAFVGNLHRRDVDTRLLTIITASLSRRVKYPPNVIPNPSTRTPLPEEGAECGAHWLSRELAVVRQHGPELFHPFLVSVGFREHHHAGNFRGDPTEPVLSQSFSTPRSTRLSHDGSGSVTEMMLLDLHRISRLSSINCLSRSRRVSISYAPERWTSCTRPPWLLAYRTALARRKCSAEASACKASNPRFRCCLVEGRSGEFACH